MAKFFGKIGYVMIVEDLPNSPGVWIENSIVRDYYGNIEKNHPAWQGSSNSSRERGGDQINDNLVLNNVLSVVADRFASENLGAMRWVEWMGTKWKIAGVEVKSPRLIITLGGVYNAEVGSTEITPDTP